MTDGLVRNRDLAASPAAYRRQRGRRLQGDGRSTPITTELVVHEGQGGKGRDQLSGVPIPVRVTGSLSNPSYRPGPGSRAGARPKAQIEEKKEEVLKRSKRRLKRTSAGCAEGIETKSSTTPRSRFALGGEEVSLREARRPAPVFRHRRFHFSAVRGNRSSPHRRGAGCRFEVTIRFALLSQPWQCTVMRRKPLSSNRSRISGKSKAPVIAGRHCIFEPPGRRKCDVAAHRVRDRVERGLLPDVGEPWPLSSILTFLDDLLCGCRSRQASGKDAVGQVRAIRSGSTG